MKPTKKEKSVDWGKVLKRSKALEKRERLVNAFGNDLQDVILSSQTGAEIIRRACKLLMIRLEEY